MWTAADLLFRIAIDEMRHWQWANAALRCLGEDKPSTERAVVIGGRPTERDRKIFPDEDKRYANPHTVSLKPVDQQIEWFIDIERPSRSPAGMYFKLLESIQANHCGEFEPTEQTRVVPILKLLIDEGDVHWHHLERIKKLLRKLQSETKLPYLRRLDRTPDPVKDAALVRDLDQCDEYYRSILGEIAASFGKGEGVQRLDLEGTRKTMQNLHALALRLAESNVGPRFDPRTILGR
jgi:hypothetical protein